MTGLLRLDRMRELRHQIGRDIAALQQMGQTVQERSELVAGKVGERYRRCGKKGCRCEKGELHGGRCLRLRGGEGWTWIALEREGAEEVMPLVENYRRFREAREEISQVCRRLLQTIDELGRLREREGYGH